MKSGKKSFDPNGALVRSSLKRFWPLWAIYTLILLLAAAAEVGTYNGNTTFNCSLQALQCLPALLAVVNIVYAPACALALFRDLYDSRLCCGIYNLPVTRGRWFLVRMLSGLLGGLIPNLLLGILLVPMVPGYAGAALTQAGESAMQYLFFYGTAVFAAVCAGNAAGMALIYGILNFADMFFAWARMKIFAPLIYGLWIPDMTMPLSPVTSMVSKLTFDITYKTGDYVWQWDAESWRNSTMVESISFTGFFGTLAVCAGAGCLFLTMAFLLMRRRKAEHAGDLLAFPCAEPVILVACTLFCGIAAHVCVSVVNDTLCYPLLLLGMVLGYYACLMLLRRQIRVFTPRSAILPTVLCAAVLLALTLTGLDIGNVSARVPETQDITSVVLRDYSTGTSFTADTTEDIGQVRSIQSSLLAHHREEEAARPLLKRIFGDEGSMPVRYSNSGDAESMSLFSMTYTLRDGTTVNRIYYVGYSDDCVPALRAIFSRPAQVFDRGNRTYTSAEELAESLMKVTVECSHTITDDYYVLPLATELTDPALLQGLLDAILQDCAEGTMAQSWTLHETDGGITDDLYFLARDPDNPEGSGFWMNVYPDSVHTLAWLAANGCHID